MNEYFKKQLDEGATDKFFYAVEKHGDEAQNVNVTISKHIGDLDSFPTNLEFIRMLGTKEDIPLFKEI